MKTIGSQLTQPIKESLFPYFCVGCEKRGVLYCQNCQAQTFWVKHQRCLVCQKPSWQGYTHSKCKSKSTPERLITFFFYKDENIKKLIGLGKYSYIKQPFSTLAEIAVKNIRAESISQFALCPIPLSKYKHNFRGFNQSLIIGKSFAKKFDLSITNILGKRGFIKQQKLLDKDSRFKNIANAFYIKENAVVPKNIILIDDITTSGSTFLSASKALKRAGAKIVWCLALAQD